MGSRHKLYRAGGVQFIYVTNPNKGFMSRAHPIEGRAPVRGSSPGSSQMEGRLKPGVRVRGSSQMEGGLKSGVRVRLFKSGALVKRGTCCLFHQNILKVSVIFSCLL